MICLDNLHPSINYIYDKAKGTRGGKGNLVQIFIFSDVNVILISKNKISTDVYYKNTSTHDYLPYDSYYSNM